MNSTKKTILITSLIASTATMILPFHMVGIAESTVAEWSANDKIKELREKASKLDPTSREFFDLIKRDPLSDGELEKAKGIINKSIKVEELMNGDTNSFELVGIVYSGNAIVLPVMWNPVIHVGNDTHTTYLSH